MPNTKTKKDKNEYAKERNDTINTLYNILELDDENSFTTYELDKDIEKQKKIEELLDDFRKYFKLSGSTYQQKGKRPYMSMIRNIMKLKYNIFIKETSIVDNGERHRTRRYFFIVKPFIVT